MKWRKATEVYLLGVIAPIGMAVRQKSIQSLSNSGIASSAEGTPPIHPRDKDNGTRDGVKAQLVDTRGRGAASGTPELHTYTNNVDRTNSEEVFQKSQIGHRWD